LAFLVNQKNFQAKRFFWLNRLFFAKKPEPIRLFGEDKKITQRFFYPTMRAREHE
jgi:hypothetical protein